MEQKTTGALEVGDAAAAAVAVAPRVTLDSIKAKIEGVRYFNDGVLTICVIQMKNRFKFVGWSAPASIANFDAELGKNFAYEDAIRRVRSHEGYLLCEKIAFEDTKI